MVKRAWEVVALRLQMARRPSKINIYKLFIYLQMIYLFFNILRPPSAVTSAINSLNNNTSLSAEEKRRVIEEEAKTLEAFKVKMF